MTAEQCHPLKYSYDVLGEQVLEKLNEISPPQQAELPRNVSRTTKKTEDAVNDSLGDEKPAKNPPRDLYAILRDHADTDATLKRFWTEINTVPEWVDWDQIGRGQDVFYRYGGANLTGLAYQSLLGGMGAARVTETLARTGGFSTKVARGRLFETTQHILQCTKSVESMQPGGEGFQSTIRVRLLHAAVRNRILKLAKTKPDYYSIEDWGVPINDLDSIGTISTFSASLIWVSLPRQGIFLRQQEIIDYCALWRYIAYVIGCPQDPYLSSPAKAKAMMEVLMHDEVKPSHTSAIMANNIIRSLQDQPPGYASADFLIAGARWLNGNELGDALGLPRPSVYYWALMAGQCIFFSFFTYTYRAVPALDKKKLAMLRRVFWAIVVESKYGLQGEQTNFDFKYVPEYSTITEMGQSQGAKLANAGIEGRNLKTLLVATGVLGVGMWVGVRIGLGILHTVWT